MVDNPSMRGDFRFEVRVSGMDLAAWAIDNSIDVDAAEADFKNFAKDQIKGSVDELLHRMGYHDQWIEVQ